jgi:hypothetical protein
MTSFPGYRPLSGEVAFSPPVVATEAPGRRRRESRENEWNRFRRIETIRDYHS